jgi:hypothetical protein
LSTNIAAPPTVIRAHGVTYIAAPDLLAIARRTGLAASTVVRVLVAQEKLAGSSGNITPPLWAPLSKLGGAA